MTARVLLIVALIGATAGCSVRSTASGTWSALVQEQSARADQVRTRGDRAGARGALVSITTTPVPAGVAADDARAVRMDAFFRLARLELEDANPEAARQWAARGLALGPREDVFTANLYLAEGQALETLGVDLEAQASYHRALVVTEALLGAALAK